MSKQFSNFWYTLRFKLDRVSTYTKTVAPCMTPEKKLLYEILTILKTEADNPERVVHKTYVTELVDGKLTTELKRTKLEGQINDGPETSADGLLKTLDQIYEEAINSEDTVPVSEELDADGEDYVEEQPEPVRVKRNQRSQRRSAQRRRSTRLWERTCISLDGIYSRRRT